MRKSSATRPSTSSAAEQACSVVSIARIFMPTL
jgi:hypothetical protein